MPALLHVDLDGAWNPNLDLPRLDVRASWGPVLRYFARSADVAAFAKAVPFVAPDIVLYGSGDFHHLTALRVRARASAPVHLIVFDNHPDWDRRPPRWSCGGWVNGLLAIAGLRSATVWGCGNFELELPWRLLADRGALDRRRLVVRPWRARLRHPERAPFDVIEPETFRAEFSTFVEGLAGQRTYVSVDMDCLLDSEACTNWESGLFRAHDVAWAIDRLRRGTRVVGADLCGAWSPPCFARLSQRLAARWDHPRHGPVGLSEARCTNHRSFEVLWPALASADA